MTLFTINGITMLNLLGLNVVAGQVARFHFIGLGSDFDLHPIHFHSKTYINEGMRYQDTINIVPGIVETVDFLQYRPGTYIAHCHT